MASDRQLTSFKAWVRTFVVTEDSTVLLVTNSNRVRYVIQNLDSILYIKLGYGCSPIDYSYRLPTHAVLEDFFQGPITACVSSGVAICAVTEEI